MVRVINIDTKTRTIRVSNADGDIKTWRTTESGTHFPIKEGQSTKEGLQEFLKKHVVVGRVPDAPAKKEPAKKEAPKPAQKSETTSWPKSPKFEKLTDQYMPKQGEADNELGEMLRSINQVVYRYYNDGDMWNKGYGKETVNKAIKHLTELAKNKETPRHIARGLDNGLYELKKHGIKDKDRYETALKILLQTVEWADQSEIDSLSKMKTEKQKPAKKESVESISDEYMREINSLRKKAEKARKMGQGKTAMLLETRADSLAKEMFEKEDSEKNARWAEHEAEMDRASKAREKAAKDQEEADFQAWKKQQKPAKKENPGTEPAKASSEKTKEIDAKIKDKKRELQNIIRSLTENVETGYFDIAQEMMTDVEYVKGELQQLLDERAKLQ